MRQEQLLELVGATNPVPVDSKRSERFPSPAALLTVIDERSGGVHTTVEPRTEEQQTIRIEPESRWGTLRRWVAAVASAAAVIVAIVLALVVFWGDRGSPDVIGPSGEPIPDFSTDRTLVGAALTAAYDSADPEMYLDMLSGAQLIFNEFPSSLGSYETTLMSWHRSVDSRWEFLDCEPFGLTPTTPIKCDVAITFQALGPELGAFAGWVLIDAADGAITKFDFKDSPSPASAAWARFKLWTQENHPQLASKMWVPSITQPVQIFSEESARLHLQLFPEFAAQDGTP